ncbi:MAG: AAA family ATPase [Janthinobacterium lividum]
MNHHARLTPEQIAEEGVRRAEWDRAAGKASGRREAPPAPPLRFLDPATLAGRPIPERKWIVPGWLPAHAVTLHYAAGGEGKTLLAQQLMTSVATGALWLGLQVQQGRAIGLFCEDDEDELHRRQDAINRSYGIDFGDLGDMRWSAPVGDDNTLLRFESDGTPVFTDRFEDFKLQAKAFNPDLVVLDVAADLFGGNENVRQQVSTFLKAGLGGLARDLGAAVLLNAHPSRAGISSGDLDGGSTGWNGGARSRWALITPREEGEPVDETVRVLTKKKANYSTRGDELQLRFRDGVLCRDGGLGGGVVASLDRRKCEEVFLDLLDHFTERNRRLSDNAHAGNFACKAFAQHQQAEGFKIADFRRAMNTLFATKQIGLEQYGRPSDNTWRLARTGSIPE